LKKKILILGEIHPEAQNLLQKKDVIWEQRKNIKEQEIFISLLRTANALIVRTQKILPQWIEKAENLEIISRHGVGVDNLPLAKLKEKNIPVCIIQDVNSISVAEHAIALLLHAAKQIAFYQKKLQAGNWKIRDTGISTELFQKTLLLIGCGKVGSKIVERLAAFGMFIKIFDPVKKKGIAAEWAFDLEATLKVADFVLLACPKNRQTINILNEKKLKLMKQGSILINTARGGLVDEKTLYQLLKTKKIAAAGFDVFANEPVEKNAPLLKLENFTATPHIASKTKECIKKTAISAVENIFSFWEGRLDPALIINYENEKSL
jgi:D-3-phosphoglycerate dehydrogenase